MAHEYDLMRAAVDAMPELMARRLQSIWCDSVACAYYVVQIKPHRFLESLPDEVDKAFESLGGYDGLRVQCEGRNLPIRDCYWPEG